jgi:hypothetical protein
MQSEDFWSNYESRIDSFKKRFDAIPSDVHIPKNTHAWLNRNLSNKRSEMEEMMDKLECKIANLEKKSSKRKRMRVVAEPRVQNLINRISDTTLREYLILQLFRPDDENHLQNLIRLCIIFVDLEDATSENHCTVFGKKLNKTPIVQELMELQNKIKKE